jgi:predicted transcriptional regulator of viral defense system
VTTAEIARLVGVEDRSVPVSLQRARDARKIVSVTTGGWVPVPPEYRAAGAPPPIHYIDPLMRHLGHRYYVGLLSSARTHGASHQVPMVLQVVTDVHLRSRRIGADRIQYVRRSNTADRAAEQHNVDTGRVTIATVETTILDVVEAPQFAGGLGNVASVLGEFLHAGTINVERLAQASAMYPNTVVQRAGWLLEHMAVELGLAIELDALHARVEGVQPAKLDTHGTAGGAHDARWNVVVNAEVEHDL